MQNNNNPTPEENINNTENNNETDIKSENNTESNETVTDNTNQQNDFETQINDLKLKWLRAEADLDNYRKRTLRERSELIKTAGEDILKAIIPVIDDMDRAIKANESANDINAIKEGIHLIANKLKNTMQTKGLMSFESLGNEFNPDIMEAITYIPATDDNQKGKVIDEIEKGYKLGDKVIRFAKVIIAQ